jgi:hypothetical protein
MRPFTLECPPRPSPDVKDMAPTSMVEISKKAGSACRLFRSKLILPVFIPVKKELTKINFIKYLRPKIFQYVVLYPEWLLLLIPAFPQE